MFIPPILELQRLRKQQWLRREQLEKIQFKSAKAMIDYAYHSVAYYRRLFNSAGITPADIRSKRDLTKIPITTRQILQQLSREEVVPEGADPSRYKRILTAGSSGTPLNVYRTFKVDNLIGAVWARAFLENGQKLWDRVADFKFQSPPKFWFETLGVWRKLIVSLLDEPGKKVEALTRVKPHIIRGNAFELVELARYVQDNSIEHLRPRLVFCFGSLLDRPSRRLIETAFKSTVFDYYGATEVGLIAWECPVHSGYHVNSDTLVTELVEDGEVVNEGESGRVVCTGLHSYDMPFIRYDLGDVATADEVMCPCGRGLPLLKSLEGRTDDFFVSGNNKLCSPSVIVNQIKLIEGLRQFRLIQESQTKIAAQLMIGPVDTATVKDSVKRTITKILGDNVDVQTEIVDDIPRDPSGKIRSMISKVRKEF